MVGTAASFPPRATALTAHLRCAKLPNSRARATRTSSRTATRQSTTRLRYDDCCNGVRSDDGHNEVDQRDVSRGDLSNARVCLAFPRDLSESVTNHRTQLVGILALEAGKRRERILGALEEDQRAGVVDRRARAKRGIERDHAFVDDECLVVALRVREALGERQSVTSSALENSNPAAAIRRMISANARIAPRQSGRSRCRFDSVAMSVRQGVTGCMVPRCEKISRTLAKELAAC